MTNLVKFRLSNSGVIFRYAIFRNFIDIESVYFLKILFLYNSIIQKHRTRITEILLQGVCIRDRTVKGLGRVVRNRIGKIDEKSAPSDRKFQNCRFLSNRRLQNFGFLSNRKLKNCRFLSNRKLKNCRFLSNRKLKNFRLPSYRKLQNFRFLSNRKLKNCRFLSNRKLKNFRLSSYRKLQKLRSNRKYRKSNVSY